MTSLFLSKPPAQRKRAISNGGLGGLVGIKPIDSYEEDAEGAFNGTWPRRRLRPLPLKVTSGTDLMGLEPFRIMGDRGLQCSVPVTPSNPSAVKCLNLVKRREAASLVSPPMSRYNPASPQCAYISLPVSPTTLAFDNLSPLAELPGSLLLPSQGFPQNNPPATPPRYRKLQRRQTDESSEISSVPTLSFSESDDMDLFKTFSSPTRKAARLAKVVESSLSSHSAEHNSQASISKPMSCMNIEELLRRLPGLSLNVVNHVWLPAMQNEFTKIKALLQDTSELKLEAHHDLEHFGEDLMAIFHDAQSISSTYEQAVQSAEELLERDTGTYLQKLEEAEKGLEAALTAVDASRDSLQRKEQMMVGLQQTLEFIVQELGPLMLDTLRQLNQDSKDHRFDVIKQLIADHPFSSDRNRPLIARYVRISEGTYLADFAKLSTAETKILQYQELAWDQNKVIKSHSTGLDKCLERYERAINTIKERDQEILLLVRHNDKCQKLIEDYENGMCVGPSAQAIQERLFKQNSELDWTIKTMELTHAKELEDRDAEIANLRQKLGSAREEVIARKADVKNVITQTQAILSPREPPSDVMLGGYTMKERKLIAKEKAKKSHFSNSASMMSLPFLGSKVDLAAAMEDDRGSDKEVLTNAAKLIPCTRPRIETLGWGCNLPNSRNYPDLRRADPSFLDLAPRLRIDPFRTADNDFTQNPRIDSLGVVENYVRSLTANNPSTGPDNTDHFRPASANTQKALPTTPETSSDGSFYPRSQNERPPIPQTPPEDYYSLTSPHRRVLSNIPEVSSSAKSNKSASREEISTPVSVTSSDREAYGKSLDALNLMEFMREGDLRIPRVRRPESQRDSGDDDEQQAEMGVARTVRVGVAKGVGAGSRKTSEAVLVEESPPRSVSELYHTDQRINGR